MRSNHVVQGYHLTPVLMLLDVLVIFIANFLVAFVFPMEEAALLDRQLTQFVLLPFMLMVFLQSGVYQAWRHKTLIWFAAKVTAAMLVITVLALIVYVARYKNLDFPSWLVSWLLLVWLGTVTYRVLIGFTLQRLRVKGKNAKRLFLIGTPGEVQEIEQYFTANPHFGFIVVRKEVIEGDIGSYRPAEELTAWLQDEDNNVDEVFICLSLEHVRLIKNLLFDFKNTAADIRLAPAEEDQAILSHPYQAVMGLNVVDLNYSPLNNINQAIKFATDWTLALCILILISPVLLALAIAIKVTSRGPVLFVQDRNGAGGETIKVYKFRSMKVHQEQQGKVTQATRGDSRLTSIGGFIRSTSLDELPQFINVLQGRMSIVGPRPHARAHNSEYSRLVDAYMSRHRVKPGITGWAQINGFRGETDTLEKMESRVKYDLWYIENWSWWLDIKIIIATVFKGFINPNAY